MVQKFAPFKDKVDPLNSRAPIAFLHFWYAMTDICDDEGKVLDAGSLPESSVNFHLVEF